LPFFPGTFHQFAAHFLYGFDPLTHRYFSHRKARPADRLRYLSAIFAIEVVVSAFAQSFRV